MKKYISIHSVIALCVIVSSSFLLNSCSESDSPSTPSPTKTGKLVLEFDNVAGEDELTLGKEYTNASGEKFKVSKFKYFVSNISLKTSAGTVFTVPKASGYFLIDESTKSSQKLEIANVPEGDYSEVTFTIGVDSATNAINPIDMVGALDLEGPANDMYWDWNSGFIFFKMEGESPAITEVEKNFRFHIGGYGRGGGSAINNIRKTTVKFNSSIATVRESIKPEIHLLGDIMKVFSGSKMISLEQNSSYMFSPNSVDISNNYVNMFSFDHVHND